MNLPMTELQIAIKKLVGHGVIIKTDAYNLLKHASDPVLIAELFLSEYSQKEYLTHDAVESLLKKSKSGVSDKKPKVKPLIRSKVPRRRGKVINRVSRKVDRKIESIDNRIKEANNKKEREPQYSIIHTSYEDLKGLTNYEPQFSVTRDPDLNSGYIGGVDDLIGYFQDRFAKLEKIFRSRLDLNNITKIKEIKRKDEPISVIGMVTEKVIRGGRGRLTIEDPTSEQDLTIILPRDNQELTDKAMQLMDDTVVCVEGKMFKGNLIAHDIHLPEIPMLHEKRRADIPVHVAFLSDIHVGSKEFLSEPMGKFIKFLNGKLGNSKMRALGKHTKYVMFGGDVVDGVGIYPGQYNDLELQSIGDQYTEFTRFVGQIPEDVEIVIIPGNHDMVRSAEPQPSIDPVYVPDLAGMKNVHLLGNPSQVSLHGVEVLLYHCTSMPDIMNHIPGASNKNPVEIMKHMLRARHLAPIWGAKTPIAAEPKDHLVIDSIPDIFHGGHIHINGEGYHRGVQIVNSGTMQSQTSFQKSLNIEPTPGQVTITNLKTFEMNKLDLMRL